MSEKGPPPLLGQSPLQQESQTGDFGSRRARQNDPPSIYMCVAGGIQTDGGPAASQQNGVDAGFLPVPPTGPLGVSPMVVGAVAGMGGPAEVAKWENAISKQSSNCLSELPDLNPPRTDVLCSDVESKYNFNSFLQVDHQEQGRALLQNAPIIMNDPGPANSVSPLPSGVVGVCGSPPSACRSRTSNRRSAVSHKRNFRQRQSTKTDLQADSDSEGDVGQPGDPREAPASCRPPLSDCLRVGSSTDEPTEVALPEHIAKLGHDEARLKALQCRVEKVPTDTTTAVALEEMKYKINSKRVRLGDASLNSILSREEVLA
uniref:Uncharacterized protein n=1 Tax=Chromera velia CCMP2878 TaxID=1169474 RepID=A0A0G4FXV5_9ALVE|eukprot:Cvel_19162.t1-p1 / transcript=Cvel_19162.t1 / gene=Cvel_19162 / organism=Chromera_velia_CCMP2878 / gene_product=hypothetical protein / transcript_product=hypothetical protein / location=Cvel_scaffold1632:17751-20262(+) / protein_length=316 / sequence_SO=supercontig / SO=protein_coding / is_pseudo=false